MDFVGVTVKLTPGSLERAVSPGGRDVRQRLVCNYLAGFCRNTLVVVLQQEGTVLWLRKVFFVCLFLHIYFKNLEFSIKMVVKPYSNY